MGSCMIALSFVLASVSSYLYLAYTPFNLVAIWLATGDWEADLDSYCNGSILKLVSSRLIELVNDSVADLDPKLVCNNDEVFGSLRFCASW